MRLHIPPAFHHRNFRLYWIGLTISIAGSQMQTWALFWHIRSLTDQPIALGGIGLARILPILVFSLVGGALADSINRRYLLFITQSIMALTALSLAGLTLSGDITLWHIYLLTALQALAVSFDTPSRQALVPNLVPARQLPNAFSITTAGFQAGAIVGPAIGGLVIAYWGQAYTYLINALSYMAVILVLILMGHIEQKTDGVNRPVVNLASIRAGFSFVLHQPMIISTMLLDFFATFFSSANTLMPIIALDLLQVGAIEYGWLSAAQAIGAVFVAVVISQLREIRRQGLVMVIAVVTFGVFTALLGFTRSFVFAMLALVFIGASDAISTIVRNTIRQLQTPDHLRGRMTSVNMIFFMGGPQLGEVEAGAVAQLFGAPIAIVSGGIGCIVAAFFIVRRWPQLLAYNGDEPILAGESAS